MGGGRGRISEIEIEVNGVEGLVPSRVEIEVTSTVEEGYPS